MCEYDLVRLGDECRKMSDIINYQINQWFVSRAASCVVVGGGYSLFSYFCH